MSGKYLVGTFYRSNTLFNTFCQKPGEVIDMTRIDGIANFAFSGCKADEMVVCDSITSFHQVSANAFVDSAFSAKPFVNGLKLAGALVLEVDKTAESIEEKIRHYFFDINVSNVSLLEYSATNTCRDAVAVAEFYDFRNEDAQKHIKKHIGRILPMLLDEKSEECISTLIMANIIPDDTLEELRETANQKNMLTVQAYLLEHMDNKKNAEKKSQTFQL